MRLLAIVLGLGLAASCASRVGDGAGPGAEVRSGTIVSRRGTGVTGTARAVVRSGGTSIVVSLIGAQPNTAHPWHIHDGTCESGGAVVGSPGAYPPLMVGTTGQAQARATLPGPLATGQNYHVNVHASATEMNTIVACGDLDD